MTRTYEIKPRGSNLGFDLKLYEDGVEMGTEFSQHTKEPRKRTRSTARWPRPKLGWLSVEITAHSPNECCPEAELRKWLPAT
jgi:hypothetical protein